MQAPKGGVSVTIKKGWIIMDIKKPALWLQANYTEKEMNEYKKIKKEYRSTSSILEKAGHFEETGETLQAIVSYESLLEKNFDESVPYDSLVVVYRKLMASIGSIIIFLML
jgi:hypothetical protein